MLKVEGVAREPIVMDPPFCQTIKLLSVMLTAASAAALSSVPSLTTKLMLRCRLLPPTVGSSEAFS